MTRQEQYDEAMFDFSQGQYDEAILKLEAILKEEPAHFDAQLSLGMAWYRKGDYGRAIEEGKKAERMRPHEQFVHTNLSLFYMKAGDKKTAEHHGLQARIASWREPAASPSAASDPELQMAKPKIEPQKAPVKFPPKPWEKKAGQEPDGGRDKPA